MLDAPADIVSIQPRQVRWSFYSSTDARRQLSARVSVPPCDVYPCVSRRSVGLAVNYPFRAPDIRLSNAHRDFWSVSFDITVTGATSTVGPARCTGTPGGAVWHQPATAPVTNPYGTTWTVTIPVYDVGEATHVVCTASAADEPLALAGDNHVAVAL